MTTNGKFATASSAGGKSSKRITNYPREKSGKIVMGNANRS